MSKKQSRAKKMSDVEAGLIALRAAEAATKPKPLVLVPQIAVGISGTFPEQELFIERPNQSPTRHKIVLTADNAYQVLMDVLLDKAGSIELERQLSEERNAKALKKHKKPLQSILIAKHPQAEIREGLHEAGKCPHGSITVLPTRASQLKSTTATKSLEEMEL